MDQQSAQSSGHPGEPTRHCTWSRSAWLAWSGRSASPACSSQCTRPPAPPGSEVTDPWRQREALLWRCAQNLWRRKEADILEGCRRKKKKKTWKGFQVFKLSWRQEQNLSCFTARLVSETAADAKYLTQRFSVLGELLLIHMHMEKKKSRRQTQMDRRSEKQWQGCMKESWLWQSSALSALGWVGG